MMAWNNTQKLKVRAGDVAKRGREVTESNTFSESHLLIDKIIDKIKRSFTRKDLYVVLQVDCLRNGKCPHFNHKSLQSYLQEPIIQDTTQPLFTKLAIFATCWFLTLLFNQQCLQWCHGKNDTKCGIRAFYRYANRFKWYDDLNCHNYTLYNCITITIVLCDSKDIQEEWISFCTAWSIKLKLPVYSIFSLDYNNTTNTNLLCFLFVGFHIIIAITLSSSKVV